MYFSNLTSNSSTSLSVETPTPIIITRVSVIPEHTILQAAKPKPSTSSDITKTWRFIAPKVSPADSQSPKPPSASLDLSQSPAGVDPTVWEVGVWRGNNGNLAQNNAYQMRWRSEYLMDFNGVRGSVVCMYCSSSLTVLKESSIKRHIVQKHPHTANFSGDEKAAIILDWENKLSEIKKIAAKPNQDGVVVGGKHCNGYLVLPGNCHVSSWLVYLYYSDCSVGYFCWGGIAPFLLLPLKQRMMSGYKHNFSSTHSRFSYVATGIQVS